MEQPIAILDSGVGGLTVVKEVIRQLPQESIVYFGDTARAPYGPRTGPEVARFTHQIIDFLLQYQPKMVVIACNTATAVALAEVRERLPIPVVGVIHPGARAAIKCTRNYEIGVIGTEGTIRSKAYVQALKSIAPQSKVSSEACPLFVPLVEEGLFLSEDAFPIVKQSLSPLIGSGIDVLILGCTHYPYLFEPISQAMGPGVTLINSAEETAREISAILHHKGVMAGAEATAMHRFFCSGDPIMFQHIAQLWLEKNVDVTKVDWKSSEYIASERHKH